jgi:hypothetical protein
MKKYKALYKCPDAVEPRTIELYAKTFEHAVKTAQTMCEAQGFTIIGVTEEKSLETVMLCDEVKR